MPQGSPSSWRPRTVHDNENRRAAPEHTLSHSFSLFPSLFPTLFLFLVSFVALAVSLSPLSIYLSIYYLSIIYLLSRSIYSSRMKPSEQTRARKLVSRVRECTRRDRRGFNFIHRHYGIARIKKAIRKRSVERLNLAR